MTTTEHVEPGAAILGDFIRSTREALGLSQEQASRRADLSKTTWQTIEGGHGRRARDRTLSKMASALRIGPEVLTGLRDGVISLPEVDRPHRDRRSVIATINDRLEWLTDDDLEAIAEDVEVRAQLRRLQRTTARTAPGDDPDLPTERRLVRLAVLAATATGTQPDLREAIADLAAEDPSALQAAATTLAQVAPLDRRIRDRGMAILDAARRREDRR